VFKIEELGTNGWRDADPVLVFELEPGLQQAEKASATWHRKDHTSQFAQCFVPLFEPHSVPISD
jgi:hypothetical protein